MKILEKITVRVREETGDVIDRTYEEVEKINLINGFLIIETNNKKISINANTIREIEEVYGTVPDNIPNENTEENDLIEGTAGPSAMFMLPVSRYIFVKWTIDADLPFDRRGI